MSAATGRGTNFGHARVGLLFSLLALLPACGGERPLVEQFEQGAWRPAPFRVSALAGQRDGSEVAFSLMLQGDGSLSLHVDGTIEIDPQARLVRGAWQERGGPSDRSGLVSATAVDFLGGQGGRPSLGGQFTLTVAGEPAYRLNLPSTVLDVTPPQP